jgi:hypothetical protein
LRLPYDQGTVGDQVEWEGFVATIDPGINRSRHQGKSIWRWLTSLASRLLTASCEVEEGTQATTGKRKSKRG